jgi:cytochrome c-type biogenesis protein CcmF
LTEGLPVDALGYRMTYTGHHPIGNEKFAFNITVEKDGRPYRVSPIMYHSAYNDGLMRNPDIVNLFTKDLYVAPLSLEQKDQSGMSPSQKARIRKGESKQLGDLQVKFVDFEFPVMEKAAMLEGKEVRIGARLEIVGPEGKKQTVTPYQLIKDGEATNLPTRYADTYDVLLLSMKPNQETPDSSSVEVGITEPAAGDAGPNRDILVVEASIKPAINLVWTGVILLLVGFIVTIYRRAQEATYTRHIT